MVLFPGGVLPLTVGRESSLALLNSLEGQDRVLGIISQLDPRVEDPTDVDLHRVGTMAKLHKTVKLPNGNLVVFVEGIARIRLVSLVGLKPFMRARVEPVEDVVGGRDAELAALERNARELFRDVVARSPQLSDDLQTVALNIDDPVRLADFIAANLPSLSTLLRQELLETADVRRRLETLVRELSKELEVLELRNKIQEQVQEQVGQSQREYLLREQMKAIQKELGESDDSQAEIEELRKKLDESGMPAEARKECDRELKRLQKMTPASAEYMVARTYLEWMTTLPWTKSSGAEDIDLRQGPGDPRRGSLRPRKGQAAHPRLPGREEAAARDEGSDPLLRRASGRGQNLAREVHRAGARTQVRARLARRHARRSGNPRPSPDLYRRAARADHSRSAPRGDQRSGVHAGRGG